MKSRKLTCVIVILIISKISKGQGQKVIESTCGRRLVRHRALITNGFESNEGDWPWHAALRHIGINQGAAYRCGGSVLNSNTVLSAAHCVYESNRRIIPERLLVQLGKHNLKFSGTNTQEFEVYKIVPHPDYNTLNLSDDIAIIRLSTEAVFNNYVQPICLWDSNKKLLSEVIGRFGTVIGWGVTEADQPSYILRQAVMPVVSSFVCLKSNRDFFGSYLSERNFCAGFRNGTSVCNGDSGGSISFEENGVYYIRGIVSLTVSRKDQRFCDTKEYVIFTDVAQYLPWIEEVVPQLKRPQSESGVVRFSPSAIERRSESSLTNDGAGPEDISTHKNLHLLPLIECGDIHEKKLILDDNKAELFEFPWMARLLYTNGTKVIFGCAGSLISDRYVLTAAHCVTIHKNKKLVVVRLGEYDTSTSLDCQVIENIEKCAPPVQDIPVEKVVFHPMYDAPSFTNNVAVIRLSKPADTTTDNVRPVCLPTTFRLQNIVFKKASNTGWGINYDNQQPSPVLLKALLPIVSNDECQNIYQRSVKLSPNLICAGGEIGVRVGCDGDTGGPLVYPTRMRMVQFGIHSFGAVTNCRNKNSPIIFPDLFVKVANYMRWILDQLEP